MPVCAGVQVLGSILSRTMLLSIEVAVEYWLSLTWSPQAQWLCDSTHDSPLRDEVSESVPALLPHCNCLWNSLWYSVYIYTCQKGHVHHKFAHCLFLYTTLIGCVFFR